MDRASVFGTEGWGFESLLPYFSQKSHAQVSVAFFLLLPQTGAGKSLRQKIQVPAAKPARPAPVRTLM